MHGVETAQSRFSGVLASVTDVTNIHELERMKSDLLGIVSHELKLPLTTILGYSEMLTDILEDEPKQYAREIRIQTKRLNQLIENFLDLARIESGQYTIRRIPFDLSVVILDAVNGVSHMADQKRITIDVDIPAKVTPLVGDEPLFLQAIINILDNSVKFSPPSTSVQVKLIEEKDNFTLKITDQGPGIALKDQEAVFDKFNRGSNKTTPQGFGLGLSLVKQVIDSHKGAITILSTPENGTTFHIILPKS